MSSQRSRKVGVLGAGIIGITTAWWLHKKGFEVTVFERQALPASETSFANGGQVSASHAAPWANPVTLRALPIILSRTDCSLSLSLKLSLSQWLWGLRFLYNCYPARARRHLQKMLAICLRSRDLYRQLLEEEDIDFSRLDKGILHIYTSTSDLQHARKSYQTWARDLVQHCCEVSVADIIALEPSLAHSQRDIVGGFFAQQDFSGDAHRFSVRLADICQQRGVVFRYNTSVNTLRAQRDAMLVETDQGDFRFDHLVSCLGVSTNSMLKSLGVRTRIYPIKGYSITMQLGDSAAFAPSVSFLDSTSRIVASRLGSHFRVAGIADLAGFEATLDDRKIEFLRTWVAEIFPRIEPTEVTPWAGLRPATPSNLPHVGASSCPRLWLNCGHGTLGWTTAMATAEQVSSDISKS